MTSLQASAPDKKGKPDGLTEIQNFIDGKYCWAAAGETFETINPATGLAHGRVAHGTAGDIDMAVRCRATGPSKTAPGHRCLTMSGLS